MSALRHIAVIDIGKTNAKVALVDLVTLSEVALYAICTSALKDEGSRIMKARRPKI